MVTIIDRLPITIIDGSRGLHTAEVPVASSLDSGLSFRSLLSLDGGTGNAPWISLRPSLITAHHWVSTLNDLAPNRAQRSAQLGLGMANGQPRALGCECWFRCAPFCLQRRTGFEETPIRPRIAVHDHLSERCFGRSDRRAQGDRATLRSIRPTRARESVYQLCCRRSKLDPEDPPWPPLRKGGKGTGAVRLKILPLRRGGDAVRRRGGFWTSTWDVRHPTVTRSSPS